MKDQSPLVVYVTSHGFGHLNRAVAVLNRIPATRPLTIRCSEDLFPHWRDRLTRPARLESDVWDVGAANPPGDSAVTDGPETLRRALAMLEESRSRLESEARRLVQEQAHAVLCDAPALPLRAARMAGVPGFALINFTWSEIYHEYAEAAGPVERALVQELHEAYAEATAILRAEPALPLDDLPRQVSVGLVVNPGQDRTTELREALGLKDSERLVYAYVGRYGQGGMPWERLEPLGDEGIHFVSFGPPGVPGTPCPRNWHVIPAADWNGADLAASADAMFAKAGYGTVCEAMAARTPMIYPPRFGFAEHRALDAALRAWGGGVPIAMDAFRNLEIADALRKALDLHPGPPPYPVDGADRAAALIEQPELVTV